MRKSIKFIHCFIYQSGSILLNFCRKYMLAILIGAIIGQILIIFGPEPNKTLLMYLRFICYIMTIIMVSKWIRNSVITTRKHMKLKEKYENYF